MSPVSNGVESGRTTATELHLPDPVERDDLGAFTARIVRLDHGALVRLRAVGERVVAWAPTPFDVLVGQHAAITDAIARHSADEAEAAMRVHLSEILTSLPRLAQAHPELFTD